MSNLSNVSTETLYKEKRDLAHKNLRTFEEASARGIDPLNADIQARIKPNERQLDIINAEIDRRNASNGGSNWESRAARVDNERRISEERAWSDSVRATEQRTGQRFSAGLSNGSLSDSNQDLNDAFRSAILEKNPAPITVKMGDNTRSFYQPGVERRDLMKTGGTGTQAMGVSVYDRIVQHMVENSAVLKAGATVINTPTGEDLIVPKSTAFSTAAITAEGATITESDPTLNTVTLKAYAYKTYFELSTELATDSQTDILDFVARQAGIAVALAYGDHLINGTGTGQPRGILADAGVGSNPTGTATSFGTQGTVNQGTDVLWTLLGSLAEPYANSPSLAWLMRNPTYVALRKLKDTAGNPVSIDNLPGQMYVDPFVPAMANTAKSVILGDFSRYFVRMVGDLRFERSDHFRFQNDLVSFRVALRLDGAVVDNNAFKVHVSTT